MSLEAGGHLSVLLPMASALGEGPVGAHLAGAVVLVLIGAAIATAVALG